MLSFKPISLCAAAAFSIAATLATPAVATQNAGRVVVQQAYLERNGWHCMQSSETPHYYVCTKVFGPTFECHFGICSDTTIQAPTNTASRTPYVTARRR